MKLKKIWQTSRPRFWIYALGPYAVGVVTVLRSHQYALWWSIPVLVFFVFFTLPANLFSYGVNDIFDYETDRLNPKKVEYESLVLPKERKGLWMTIALTTLPFLLYTLFALPLADTIALLCFFVFAASYSVPPIRAKARPYFDSMVSGLHYISPGIVGYVLGTSITGTKIPLAGFVYCVVAGFLWSAAMHAFSAIPDIEADKNAGLATIATSLGKKNTLIVCTTLYALSGLMLIVLFTSVGATIAVIYVALMLTAFKVSAKKIFTIYTIFPIVNTLAGMAIFFCILLK